MAIHHDFGGEDFTRLDESPTHRRKCQSRHTKPKEFILDGEKLFRCHTTADEELVNVDGHPAGSLDFEFVSWSQGLVRHNFLNSNGKINELSSPERLRTMVVVGMIAEMEASLRATALATKKATYGITSAQRGARLASIQ